MFFFFFFKQKTAYEIRLSLVGSEMCIRDSFKGVLNVVNRFIEIVKPKFIYLGMKDFQQLSLVCLLYTSDAADE